MLHPQASSPHAGATFIGSLSDLSPARHFHQQPLSCILLSPPLRSW